MTEQAGLVARTFQNKAAALGLAVSYLMTKPAFARLPFGHWSRVLTGQINRGHYFFVYRDKAIVGFAGWALASTADAETWLAGRSNPALEDGSTGTCIVLNAWVASDAEANRFLFDHMRLVGKGKEALYAKREYPDGRSRPLRLRGNEILARHVRALEAQDGQTVQSG